MDTTFVGTPTLFSIRIIETGYIKNVNLFIDIYNPNFKQIFNIPCEHTKRCTKIHVKNIRKSRPYYVKVKHIPRKKNILPFWDLFTCIYNFDTTTSQTSYYYFKFSIEKTENGILRIENFCTERKPFAVLKD